MSEPVIIFDNVSKSYPFYQHVTGGIKHFLFNLPKSLMSLNQRFEAIRDISFEVNRGEAFGIIGKNGAGKSTTLSLIAKVLKPNGGEVIVKDRVSPMLELGAGFHPEMSGRENIMLNGVLMGLLRAEIVDKLDDIIEFSEVADFIDQPIRMYSSGMLAKLGFSIIAHLDPEIMLLDEVMAVGDIRFQEKCLRKMEEFRQREDVTFVMVSHAMDAVRQVCDRAAWIDNHVLRMVGPADEVTKAFEEHYMPTAPPEAPSFKLARHTTPGRSYKRKGVARFRK